MATRTPYSALPLKAHRHIDSICVAFVGVKSRLPCWRNRVYLSFVWSVFMYMKHTSSIVVVVKQVVILKLLPVSLKWKV